MAESYFDLRPNEAAEMLVVAGRKAGRPAIFIEKDIWGVWCMEKLFAHESFGDFLVFKGGTSLSKAHGLIQRFSEDVDIACDIREFMPDLEMTGIDYLPPSNSKRIAVESKLKKLQRDWIGTEVLPLLKSRLAEVDPRGSVEWTDSTGPEGNAVFVRYTPLTQPVAYISHAVKLEFYPRSSGEPCSPMPVACDVANHVRGVDFPSISLRTLAAERTFWEKAAAMHVVCLRRDMRGKGYFRHLYDIVCLARAGVAERAVDDRELAFSVAEHLNWFRKAKYGDPAIAVEYHDIHDGGLRLVPDDKSVMDELRVDYQRMANSGMFFGEVPLFDPLLDECRELEARINGRNKTLPGQGRTSGGGRKDGDGTPGRTGR